MTPQAPQRARLAVGLAAGVLWAAFAGWALSLKDSDGKAVMAGGDWVIAVAAALVFGFLLGLYATTLWARDRAKEGGAVKDTKIRWATDSWNPMSGCTRISPGCDRCYAFTIAEKFRGGPAYPVGFDPMWRGERTFGVPRRRREPRRYFVNSMSDLHHEAFGPELLDRVYDEMAELDRHQFLVLTKRPKRMHRYLCGSPAHSRLALGLAGRSSALGWLERRGLDAVPGNIWLGVSIESSPYLWRADWLRRIPVPIRFLSCEPLLGPLDELKLDGISWVIAGGESGSGFRPMDWDWARALRDLCVDERVAFFHKQGSSFRSEQFQELDGQRWEESPLWHPTTGVVEIDPASESPARAALAGT